MPRCVKYSGTRTAWPFAAQPGCIERQSSATQSDEERKNDLLLRRSHRQKEMPRAEHGVVLNAGLPSLRRKGDDTSSALRPEVAGIEVSPATQIGCYAIAPVTSPHG